MAFNTTGLPVKGTHMLWFHDFQIQSDLQRVLPAKIILRTTLEVLLLLKRLLSDDKTEKFYDISSPIYRPNVKGQKRIRFSPKFRYKFINVSKNLPPPLAFCMQKLVYMPGILVMEVCI